MTHRSTSDAKDMKALEEGGKSGSHQEQSLEPPPPRGLPAVRTVEPTPSLLTEVPFKPEAGPRDGAPSTQRP